MQVKPKRCREKAPGCCGEYIPRSTFQATCHNPGCAIKKAQRDKAKRERAKRVLTRAERLAVKPRGEWLKDAQTVFNTYIRQRDAGQPCFSCGRNHTGQYHASHYLSVGARPGLRFCEVNCHKACSVCNAHLSGNITLYRIALVKKYGPSVVDWLEGYHERYAFTIEDCKEIIAEYRERIRRLRKKSRQ